MNEEKRAFRIHRSGVWLGCTIIGPGELPGSWRIRGRRCHMWSHESEPRLDVSQLARSGPGRGSRISDEVEVEFPLNNYIESQPMSTAALSALDRVEVWSG